MSYLKLTFNSWTDIDDMINLFTKFRSNSPTYHAFDTLAADLRFTV